MNVLSVFVRVAVRNKNNGAELNLTSVEIVLSTEQLASNFQAGCFIFYKNKIYFILTEGIG